MMADAGFDKVWNDIRSGLPIDTDLEALSI
jgi:hypothetical protein